MNGSENSKKEILFLQEELWKDPVKKQRGSTHPYRQKVEILQELILLRHPGAVCYYIEKIPGNPEKDMPPYPVTKY